MNVVNKNLLSLAILAALAGTSVPAMAQSAQDNQQSSSKDSDKDKKELDKVVVVGSRIKRAQVEGPAPVTVITTEQFEREGLMTIGDALQTLPGNTTASFTGDQAVSGFTPNAQVVNLRNLGPGYTLTLVNGHRPAQYPQPYNRDNNVINVKAIPSSIVERTEILTGGASAIYGSDAVAGVVNIVTKKKFDGQVFRARYGTTEEGGGQSQDYEYTGGHTGSRWSAMWSLQYGRNNPVFGSQRDFMADTRNGPLGPNFTNPALSLIAIRGNKVGTEVAGVNAFFPGKAVCDAFGYTEKTTASRGHYCGSYTQNGSRSIYNANQYYSVYGSGTFDITSKTQAFASVTYYDSKARSSSGTEFWGTSGDRFNTTSTGGASTYYYDPQFGGLIQLQRVFNPFELGGSDAVTTHYTEKTYDVTGGVRGNIADRFDWDVTAQYSHYDYTANRPRLLAKAVHDYFLGPLQGYVSGYPVYNLDKTRWTTPLTPEQYQKMSTRVINQGVTTSKSIAFTMSGDLFQMPAGPVGFAGTLEGVRQTVDLRSDPRTNPLRPADEQTVYNLVSSGRTEGTRDRYAIGAEFRVPLMKTLTAQIAGRYDKYNDISAIGGAFTYNLGLEYRPTERLLLRSSYATSFRAPDMQLIYAQGAASYSNILDQYACLSGTGASDGKGKRTYVQCNVSGDTTIYSTQTVIAGNPKLTDEKGKSFGAGFVWDMTDTANVSIDYWRIRLADSAAQLGSGYLLATEAACRLGSSYTGTSLPSYPSPSADICANVTSLITRTNAPGTPLDGRIERINNAYVNTALTDTSGVDTVYNWRHKMGRFGNLNINVAHSIVMTYKYKLLKSDVLRDYRDGASVPQRVRTRGSIGWNIGTWNSTLFFNRYGSAVSAAGANGVNAAGQYYSTRLGPYITYNLAISKRIGDHLTIDFNAINLTNKQYRSDNSYTGYPYYDYTIGSDPLGRRYFLSARYKF